MHEDNETIVRREESSETPQAPTEGLRQAALSFQYRLRLIKDAQTANNNASAEMRRYDYINYLLATANFLEAVGVFDIANDLAMFASALDDLNRGTQPALLRPEKLNHRAPDESWLWLARSNICLAVETLSVAGKTRAEAAAFVSEKWPVFVTLAGKKAKANRGGKRLSPQIIVRWLDQFRAGTVSVEEAQAAFARNAELLKAWTPGRSVDALEAHASYLLQDAARQASLLVRR